MPLVDFKCKGCHKKVNDAMFDITEDYEMNCPNCGKPMQRIYTAPATFSIDFVPGYNTATDQYFSTKKEKDTYLRENGLEVRR
jgi:putative FmdB family regulatory protein